jgi:transcriptional regulator with GAF, ATPase, and Fis domain
VALLRATVLLTGRRAPKGAAARALHGHSRQAQGPFVHVDCAALSPTLIESELFGHERGAFTGALDRRVGRFELAAEGSVFLDEIGELDEKQQAKLLRVLHDREYERIGGVATLPMTARVIAATSRSLLREVREGRFRADLTSLERGPAACRRCASGGDVALLGAR